MTSKKGPNDRLCELTDVNADGFFVLKARYKLQQGHLLTGSHMVDMGGKYTVDMVWVAIYGGYGW